MTGWERINRVWSEVLLRPEAERLAAVDELCGTDEALRRDVRSLLQNLQQANAAGFAASSVASVTRCVDIGSQVGPYVIAAQIGAGGMGEVYRAHDSRLGRDVAIKVLLSAVVADPERVRRFEQEARAAAALNHPQIVAVYDIGYHQGSPFIVSELLEGETLRHHLEAARSARLPLRKAFDYALQIARGLAAAHGKGIVHRDLKPENVFITPDGRAKILDFGLAKLTEADVDAAATEQPRTGPGLVLGTAGYMAPEQVRGLAIDARVDIFAFGATLYEMLSGRRAFQGATTIDVMTSVLSADPPWQPLVDAGVPASVVLLVQRCLEKDPAARFHSAADLAFALDALAGSPTAAVAAAPANTRRRHLAAAGTGLVGVAIGAFAVTGAFRWPDGSSAAPEVRLQIESPLRSDEVSFRISPDGANLVFLAPGQQDRQLWIRPLAAETARPVPGTERLFFPFWSPDSKAVAFFADGKLKRIDLDTGFVRTLADVPNPRRGAWHADGTILFGASTGPLYRVASTGGPVTVATTLLPGQSNHRWPVFIPGTRDFFLFAMGAPDVRGVFRGSLDRGDIRRVMNVDSAVEILPPSSVLLEKQGALWAQRFTEGYGEPVGDLIAVAPHVLKDVDMNGLSAMSTSANGTIVFRPAPSLRQLVWFDRKGTQVGTANPPEPTQLNGPAISVDGRSAAVCRVVDGNTDSWLLELQRGTYRRITSATSLECGGILSPQGDQMVFPSDRNYNLYDLYLVGTNAPGKERLLLESLRNKIPTAWSPDGKFIAYSEQSPETDLDVWAIPVATPSTPIPIAVTRFGESGAEFSPDGHWVAFVSDETGRPEIYVQSFPGPGPKRQISVSGGVAPRWRRHELFFMTVDRAIAAVSIRLLPNDLVVDPPRRLFTIPPTAFYSAFDASPDGARFLVTMGAATTPPVTVVLNWKSPH